MTDVVVCAPSSITGHPYLIHSHSLLIDTTGGQKRVQDDLSESISSTEKEMGLNTQAFFIFNQKGEVLISRLFRTDLK